MNDELDLNQLNHVTAGYSANSREERLTVMVNQLLTQYITGTLNETIVTKKAREANLDPQEVWDNLEAAALEVQNGKTR